MKLLTILFFFTFPIYSNPSKISFNTINISSVPIHAGGIVKHNNKFYWYGENREEGDNNGVDFYVSNDFKKWEKIKYTFKAKNIVIGCSENYTIERPKIIYNKSNQSFIMWMHIEKNDGLYKLSSVGVAQSKYLTGPYYFIKSFRINKNQYALNWRIVGEEKSNKINKRDIGLGQMSRDINIFQDKDNVSYLISTSEDNATLIISKMNKNYNDLTGEYIRVQPGHYNEAPIMFKLKNKYYIYSSGTTGWEPNQASLYSADRVFGKWKYEGVPVKSRIVDNVEKNFHSQGFGYITINHIMYYLGDVWRPSDIKNSGLLIKKFHLHKNLTPYISDK